MPPAIVERTDAATLATALHRRCEALLRARGVPTVLIINADKASSCVSLACHEAATFATKKHCMSMYGNCQMHMIFASLGSAVTPLKQVAFMFCATNLIHRANNMKLVRKLVREIVGELMDVRHPAGFALPSPTQLTQTHARQLCLQEIIVMNSTPNFLSLNVTNPSLHSRATPLQFRFKSLFGLIHTACIPDS